MFARAAGFTTGSSSSCGSVVYPAFINVWSGLNGTGALLGSLNPPTIAFSGTADSVDFGGPADEVAFADVTPGSPLRGRRRQGRDRLT